MKNNFIYIIIIVVGIAGGVLLVQGLQGRKKFDDKVTLRRQDKIPYGTNVAYRSLALLFPNASISVSRSMPGYWDSLSMDKGQQAFICITSNFDPEEFELNKLIQFAEAGNDVFISAIEFSYDAEQKLFLDKSGYPVHYPTVNNSYSDSLVVSLLKPVKMTWSYPGTNAAHTFSNLDEKRALVLGEESGSPNFIHLKAGKGNFFIHRAPLAFSNYFLLHKNNMGYYEAVMSLFSPDVRRIVWDEYFLTRRHQQKEKEKSWFSVLMQYPGLSTALIVGLLTLLLYALSEMRRKQRIIPPYNKPKNESLDFVKTIGRLYFEKGNHRNLAKKMSSYFLEYVRSRYKLPTSNLDDAFVRALQFKSGVEEVTIRDIVVSIHYFDDTPVVTPKELNAFYRKLEYFYRTA